MDIEDLKPRPARSITVGDDLTALSVADLEARAAALRAEIVRTEQEIAVKSARRTAADALFRRPEHPGGSD